MISFMAYGVAIGITVEHDHDAESCPIGRIEDRVATFVPPDAERVTERRADTTIIAMKCSGDRLTVPDAERGEQSFDSIDAALHGLDQAIRSTIALNAPGLVFIHAGAVAVDGRVLVLPGRSMAGKTTLVAALLEAGATYLSDEYALFDPEGLVHPYARLLSIRGPSGRREVPASDLGTLTATMPLPVGLVAELRYDETAGWQVEQGNQGACARVLIDNAVAAQARSAEVLASAARCARSHLFLHGTRGDAAHAAGRLIELVGQLPLR